MPWPLGNEAVALWKTVNESCGIDKGSQCGVREKRLGDSIVRYQTKRWSSKDSLDKAYVSQCALPLCVAIVHSLQRVVQSVFVDQSLCLNKNKEVAPVDYSSLCVLKRYPCVGNNALDADHCVLGLEVLCTPKTRFIP